MCFSLGIYLSILSWTTLSQAAYFSGLKPFLFTFFFVWKKIVIHNVFFFFFKSMADFYYHAISTI